MSPLGNQNKQDKRNEQEPNMNEIKNQQFKRRATNTQTAERCNTFKRAQALLKKGSNEENVQAPYHTDKYPIVKNNSTNMKIMQQSKLDFPIVLHAKISTKQIETNTTSEPCDIMKEAQAQHKIKYVIAKEQYASDYTWVGEATTTKNHKHARFWLQNPNGVKMHSKFKHLRSDLESLRQHKIDFLAMPESRLNAQNSYVHQYFPAIIERHYPGSHINISNTPGFGRADVKQNGGVVSIAMNNLTGNFAGKGRDGAGRYNWIMFRGKDIYLKVITLYRVNKSGEKSAGTSSAWTEQWLWIKERNKKRKKSPEEGEQNKQLEPSNIDPRKEVTTALLKDIKSDMQKGYQIILLADANEDVMKGEFTNSLEAEGMTNVVKEFIPQIQKVRSHQRGSKIIDGVWATALVTQNIVKAGLAPFYDGIVSDHRGIYFDLNVTQLLSQRETQMPYAKYRRLQSTIPCRARKYCASFETMWNHHKIGQKIKDIEEYANDGSESQNVIEVQLNKIDKEITNIMKAAEKGCCNIGKQSTKDWSPQLARLIKLERTTSIKLKKLKKCQLKEVTAERTCEIRSQIQELREIRRELKKSMKNSADLRKIHLQELAIERARLKPGRDSEKELKRLQHIEEQRRVAKAIRRTHKNESKTGLSYILIPAKDSYGSECEDPAFNHYDFNTIWEKVNKGNWNQIRSWERIEEVNVVEDMMLKCMQQHFHQAHGTPLTSEYWKDKLQDQKFIQQIREGDLSSLENEPKPILEYFKAMSKEAKPTKSNPTHYTLEMWTDYIKSVKEKTATSPAGRHFGHWKTILTYLPKIFNSIFKIMQVAMKNDILLDRWKKTVTILIEKHVGKPYIHRTRPLHIVEPEVNAIAKLVWAKQIMHEAEKENKVTKDQYGGRKGRQAQSAVLNKILYYNINAQTLTTAQYDDDDLRSNYDREMVGLVLLEAQVKHGLHIKNANFVRKFIQQQQFFIKTNFGISEASYEDTSDKPIYGMGQGLAWAGPAWIMASNTICKIKNSKCKGLLFHDPITKKSIEKVQDLFVDDLSGGTNQGIDGMDTPTSIMKQGSRNLQEHVNLVNVTGGDIALEKCWFYLIEWIFENGEAVAQEMSKQNAELILHSPTSGEEVFIAQIDADSEHKTLGCYVNPLGINVQAYNQIYEFAKNWREANKTANLRNFEVIHSYYSTLLPKIIYRLPTYSFTYAQCEEIMKVIRPTILHAMKLQEHFPKIIMEAGQQYMGLQVKHIYDIMGSEKMKFLLMHLRRKDVTGKLMEISMKHTQLECGSRTLFFNLDFDDRWGESVTWTWMVHLWEYLSESNITTDLSQPITIKSQRQNDQFVMDILHTSSTITKNIFVAINKVRQCYKIILLSDIANLQGNGTIPIETMMDDNKKSTLKFRPQAPTEKMIQYWKKFAIPILSKYLRKNPLGSWIRKPHTKTWNAYVTPDQRYILDRKTLISYEMCNPISRQFREIRPRSWINKKMFPADIRYLKQTIQMQTLWNRRLVAPATQERNINENHGQRATLCGSIYGELWGKVQMGRNQYMRNIFNLLCEGEIVAATDGSCRNSREAHAWCLAEKIDANMVVKGCGPVHNSPEDANSTRPEMYGIIAVLSFAGHIIQYFNANIEPQDIPTIVLYTDSEISINNTAKSHFPTTRNSFETNIDVKIQLSLLLKKLPFKVKFEHVYAHQQGKIEWNKMHIKTQLNTLMDEHTATYFRSVQKSLPHKQICEHLPAQVISFSLPFDRPTSNILPRLQNFRIGHAAEEAMAKAFKIHHQHMKMINWKALLRAFRSYTQMRQYAISKCVYRQWCVMERAKLFNIADNDRCPLCANEVETWEHVFGCKSDAAKLGRLQGITNLKKVLLATKTSTILTNRLIALLSQTTQGFRVQFLHDSDSTEVRQAFQDIKKLGAWNFLKGIHPMSLEHAQQKHYDTLPDLPPSFTGENWSKRIISAVHEYSHGIWAYRCEVIHENQFESVEIRTKKKAHELLTFYRSKPWMLQPEDRHLIRRRDFRKSTDRSIRNWISRLEESIGEQANRDKIQKYDIRKFIRRDRI